MNSSKLVKFGISAFIFLIVASLLLHVGTIIVDFYDGIEKEEPNDDSSKDDNKVEAPENGEENEEKPPKEENPEGEITYVTNLSEAPGAGFVEGLYTNISIVGDNAASEMYKKLTANIPMESDIGGMLLSHVGVYSGENFALAKSAVKLPTAFSVGKETVKVPVKYTKGTSSEILIKYEEDEADIKAVELYMGYIIINSEDQSSSLYNENGEKICDLGDKEPAYKRTYDGTPIFRDAKKYYIFSSESGEFEEISESKIVFGLEYDYPAYSYKTAAGVHIYASYVSSKKVYTYLDAYDEKQEIKTNYSMAYNFGPTDCALVKLTSGSVRIINSAGKTVHTSPTTVYTYYPEGTDAGYSIKVQRYYALPYLNDISAIGSGTIDEYGWMRIRIQLKGRSPGIGDKIVGDYETLINAKGELFEIPEGYTLEGYSDGVLLLSRNGLYGYYTVEGKWIANPIYTFASPFVQGLAALGYSDGTVGMIDTDGNIVLPFAFRYVSNVSSGLVAAYSESGGWEVFKLMERQITE